MNKRMTWLRPVIPAGATLFLLLAALIAGVPAAHADTNVVRIDPSGVAVAPGGSFHVGVVDDPPPASLAAWVLELTFDPNVVTTSGEDCKSITTPGGAVGAFDCETADTDNDGKDETVKILGAVLFSRSQLGLVNESTLADITFEAVGDPGTCSDLKLQILIHSDAQGNETGAKVQDGHVCISGSAPPTGTASAFPETPRTSAPTPVGTAAAVPTVQSQPGTPAPTPTIPPVSGATRPPVPTAARVTAAPVGGGTDTTDSSGTNAVVWFVVASAVLVIAAGGAWGMVRLRGRRLEEPPGPPSPPEPPRT